MMIKQKRVIILQHINYIQRCHCEITPCNTFPRAVRLGRKPSCSRLSCARIHRTAEPALGCPRLSEEGMDAGQGMGEVKRDAK